MSCDKWQKKEPTEKQIKSFIRMKHALGDTIDQLPQTRGEASKEIVKMRGVIEQNIRLGGTTNPRHSSLVSDADWGLDHNGN